MDGRGEPRAGLPKQSWIPGLEASRHADGPVHMTVDNHRSDDNRNYLFRSTDFGAIPCRRQRQ